jgi:alkanesulfonate monooxygenase SsuD/methylene tetrahydromethanopterin reductase-like flavin-dependent oxidoreductase (luciferase family)
MRFGLLQEGLRAPGEDPHRRYLEMVEEAIVAEEAGFDFYANSEQHFHLTADIVSVSAPESFLPFVAARTRRIRLRTASTVLLEFNHPVRVAERVATLDVLSGGRAELGTARSNNVRTLEAFSIDPTTTRAQWTEALTVVVACLTHDPFEHRGELWDVPARTLSPPCVQQPHPPIYVSASGPETHAIAGRLGIGAMTGASIIGWQHVERCAAAYHEAVQDPQPISSVVNKSLCFAALGAHCAETSEQAFEDARRPTMAFMRRMLGPGGMYESLVKASPDYGYLAGVAAEARERMDDLEYIVSIAPYMSIGTPDFLIDRFRRLERLGYNEVLLRIDGMGHDTNVRGIQAFGRDVIPAFTPAPALLGSAATVRPAPEPHT